MDNGNGTEYIFQYVNKESIQLIKEYVQILFQIHTEDSNHPLNSRSDFTARDFLQIEGNRGNNLYRQQNKCSKKFESINLK